MPEERFRKIISIVAIYEAQVIEISMRYKLQIKPPASGADRRVLIIS